MAFSTLVSFGAGLGFLRWPTGRLHKLCLVVPVVVDLSLLGFFKYANFTLDSVHWLGERVGVQIPVQHLDVLLPIGISFYTFHTISYVVDCYRGTVKPTRNFLEFACYVSLFAQLVAGPIVRFRQIEGDLDLIDSTPRDSYVDRAWSFICIGFIKKVLIADTLAALIAPDAAATELLPTLGAWSTALGYAYQLYFDFSGYSDMAVGLGLLFGLRLPKNFDSPYKALDPSDFWRRWHISLSTVLRDYLYIPLGGNRGSALATYRNLMITMVLGGLWHGANVTFLIWGAYHGGLLLLYRRFGGAWDRLPALGRQVAMFLLVVIGWVFFRCATLDQALNVLHSMFTWRPGDAQGGWPLVAALGVAAGVAHGLPNTFEISHEWKGRSVAALGLAFALALAVIYVASESPFLYFQF
jgi:alginate O-acetyltransferase complex protein AlgI